MNAHLFSRIAGHWSSRFRLLSGCLLLLLSMLAQSAQAQLLPMKLPARVNMPNGAVTSTTNQAYKKGDPVLVLATYNTEWAKATILSANGSTCKIHYFGKPDSNDEAVELKRIRRPKRYRTGEQVQAEDVGGSWYNATIQGMEGNLYRVRYEGRNEDESKAVDQPQIRPMPK